MGCSCDSFHRFRSISSCRCFHGLTVGKGAGRNAGTGGNVGVLDCDSSITDDAGVELPWEEPGVERSWDEMSPIGSCLGVRLPANDGAAGRALVSLFDDTEPSFAVGFCDESSCLKESFDAF